MATVGLKGQTEPFMDSQHYIQAASVTHPSYHSRVLDIRDGFEDAMVETKAKARSFRIKATYAYEILHD